MMMKYDNNDDDDDEMCIHANAYFDEMKHGRGYLPGGTLWL